MIANPVCWSLLALLAAAAAPATQPSNTQILAWLRELKPLPKVHYSWPVNVSLFEREGNPFLFEYVRITRSVGISANWAKESELDAAVLVCKTVNEKAPGVPATLAINYSPWHMRFGKDLPPTDTGPTETAELDLIRSRLGTIDQWLKSANTRYQASVGVSAILLDTERFWAMEGNAAWNEAIRKKYDAVYDICAKAFPNARIEWYARGGVARAATETGWSDRGWFPLTEKGTTYSCSLYAVPMIDTMRETFRRTVERAQQHGVKEVTPWIALGAGYKPAVDRMHVWQGDWDYDLVFSWLLGAEVNINWYGTQPVRFAPWNAAKVAVFYPGAFDPRTPSWGKHFVAYVRGATGVKKLPGDP